MDILLSNAERSSYALSSVCDFFEYFFYLQSGKNLQVTLMNFLGNFDTEIHI